MAGAQHIEEVQALERHHAHALVRLEDVKRFLEGLGGAPGVGLGDERMGSDQAAPSRIGVGGMVPPGGIIRYGERVRGLAQREHRIPPDAREGGGGRRRAEESGGASASECSTSAGGTQRWTNRL